MDTPLNTLKNVNKHYLIALERAGLNTVEKLCTMTYSGLKAVKLAKGAAAQAVL